MNEFVSWCRHLLVSFLFHALTSLHPPSFHRNDFPLVPLRYCHTVLLLASQTRAYADLLVGPVPYHNAYAFSKTRSRVTGTTIYVIQRYCCLDFAV